MPSESVRPPLKSYEDVSKLIDHSLLRPELTAGQVLEGLELATRYDVASVCMRPCDIDVAVRALDGTRVKPGSVVAFPHGSQNTATKLFETRELLRRGAKEVDAVIAISKLLSREFQYVQTELSQLADVCHKEGAILKVIFENAYLTDELKIVACRCSERAGADFVKTSTGFAPSGYTVDDVRLMRRNVSERIQVKAAGGLRTLDKVLEAYEAGCSRVGATATAAILDEWKARIAATRT
jgi:deoxyribose-phosphate aldolase